MSKAYDFIHITKSGGSCFYFNTIKASNYRDFFEFDHDRNPMNPHGTVCSDVKNPIVIIRDVESRFYSMYKYWKNGSSLWGRSEEQIERVRDYSIIDFINLIKKRDLKKLIQLSDQKTIWLNHFLPSSHWIKENDYTKTIIIKYNNNLNNQFQKFFKYLGVDIGTTYPVLNKSLLIDEKEDWEKHRFEIDEFIFEYFKDDVRLIDTIMTEPSRFRLVI